MQCFICVFSSYIWTSTPGLVLSFLVFSGNTVVLPVFAKESTCNAIISIYFPNTLSPASALL